MMEILNSTTSPCPFVLVELSSMEAVYAPVRNTQRVKYTCFDVSRRYIIFGSTSGGIYVFLRETLQYLKTVTNKDGPVSQVALAPDDSIVAFATSRGHVLVVEHNVEKESGSPHRLQFTYEHKGALVTALHWSNTPSRLYAGDDSGRVSFINVSLSRTRSLFQVPSAILMKVDSRIVQLDYAKDYLLVSSLTRAYIYNTITEQWVQIGKKIREGDFGACLYPGPRYQDSCTIFAARPGARLWEVDLLGNVVSTHQFKAALNIPPAKVFSYKSEPESSGANSSNSSSQFGLSTGGFSRLHTLWPSSDTLPFILTWSAQGIYMLNPKKVEVLLRIEIANAVKSSVCYKSSIYIQHGLDQFCHFCLLPLDQAIKQLFHAQLYVRCAELIIQQAHHISEQPNRFLDITLMKTLLSKLHESGHSNLANLIEPLHDAIKQVQNISAVESPPIESSTIPPGRSPRRPRSALSDRISSRRTSPKPCRCRSASPQTMHQRKNSFSSPGSCIPVRTPPSPSLSGFSSDGTSTKKNIMVLSLEDTRKLVSIESTSSTSKESFHKSASTSSMSIPGLENSKSFPQLLLNGLLSPVDEVKNENSPVTNIPNLHLGLLANQQGKDNQDSLLPEGRQLSLNLDSAEHLKSLETEGANIQLEDNTLSYEMSYRLLSLSVHGGGVVFPPGFDLSLLASSDLADMTTLDLGKVKDSISNTFTSGKKALMQNFRDLENRFKQMSLHDSAASSSSSHPQSSGFCSPCRTPEPPNDDDDLLRNSPVNYLNDCSFWESVPSVDLNPLYEATAEARLRLQDPDVLLDNLGQHQALRDWIEVLNATQKQILHLAHKDDQNIDICDNIGSIDKVQQEVNGNNVVHLSSTADNSENWNLDQPARKHKVKLSNCPVVVYCPFKMPPESHAHISTLAKICFRTKCFGSNLKQLSPYFCGDLWEDRTPLGQLSNSPLDRRKTVPKAKRDQNGNDSEDNTKNSNVVLFVRNYFHLLGFDSENREELFEEWVVSYEDSPWVKKETELRYHTWCALISGFQLMNNGTDNLFSSALVSGNTSLAADDIVKLFKANRFTVGKIVRLARLDYKKTLEVCIKLCQQMSAVDILYISRCTKFHPNLFLNCIEEVLRHLLEKNRIKSYCHFFASQEVRNEWMRCVLEHHPPTTNGDTPILKCQSCGKPMPGSHLHPWPFGRELLQVLDIFGSKEQDYETVSSLCYDKGFWPGYLLLLRKRKEREKHLETLRLLDDARLLSDSHPLGYLPSEMEQWKIFLKQIMDRPLGGSSNVECLQCTSGQCSTSTVVEGPWSLTLDWATRRMLLVFRPTQVLKLLRSLQIKPGHISATTYRATILTHLIDAQQNILSHSMLARLESYLWSRRSIAIPPQVWKVLEEERSAKADQCKFSPTKNESPTTPLELRQRYLRYLEEPDNHWGVSTQLQRSCPLCGIPLCSHLPSSTSISKVSGVTVGSCGHAFHSNCVGQICAPCPICIDRGPGRSSVL